MVYSTVFVRHSGPLQPPYQLQLLAVSSYEAQVSWAVPFDGNEPVVMYHILAWKNDVNVSCSASLSIHRYIMLLEM